MDRVAKLVRNPPKRLAELIVLIHQDFQYEVAREGGLLQAFRRMTAELGTVDRKELEPVIRFLLQNARPDELKAMLRRHGADYFFDSKTSKQIFEAWLDGLKGD